MRVPQDRANFGIGVRAGRCSACVLPAGPERRIVVSGNATQPVNRWDMPTKAKAGEELMTLIRGTRAILTAVFAATLCVGHAAAQQGRPLPRFEVDASWPKVPPNLKVGDVSSFAVNAQDQVFLLHRSRTLKPEQMASAAPPVMVFDAAGNYLRGWGGAGQGYEWVEREHGIYIDPKGFVWLGGNNCP